MRVDELVDAAAARWGSRVAWTFDDGSSVTELGFGDVARRSLDLAESLGDRGVCAGSRVAVMLDNRPEFPLTWLALARLGAAMVPVNPGYGSADLAHLLAASQPSHVVTTAALGGALTALPTTADTPVAVDLSELGERGGDGVGEPMAAHDASQTLNLQFTSGTTGLPKACVLPHAYWVRLARSLVEEFPYLTADDVMLTAQPFHYVDPQWNVVAALLAGARLVVLDGFHPRTFWQAVRRHQVTYFYCLAAMPTLLLTTPANTADREHRVRAVQCSAIPPARHAELEDRWGVPWTEAFGMTETGADLRVTDADHDELVGSGCVGAPTRDREARVPGADGDAAPLGEPGRLELRGPGMMSGYLADLDAGRSSFDASGWFTTGDLARLDDRGRVYLVGRSKDMVRRSGENIAAREVEDVLQAHPAVRLAAVLGVDDELRGQEVKAVLCPVGAAVGPALDVTEVARWCEGRLAAFKVPRYWEVRDQLPLTASARVRKSELGDAAGPVFDRTQQRWLAPAVTP